MATSAFTSIARQIGYEQRSFWRNPPAVGFTLAFPLVFLVIFTAIYSNQSIQLPGGIVKFAQYFVPSIISFGIISACFATLAIVLTFSREMGLTKRVRGTPLRPSIYLGGIIGNAGLVAIILTVLVMAFGLTVYGVTFPDHAVALVLTILVGGFCFSACGTLMSTLIPNEDAAVAIANFVMFPLLFISGNFAPVGLGTPLGRISSIFPVRHFNEALADVFNPFTTGHAISGDHLGIMLAWGTGAIVLSVVRFRWEPSSR